MKTTSKKIFCFILAAVLTLGMSLNVLADPEIIPDQTQADPVVTIGDNQKMMENHDTGVVEVASGGTLVTNNGTVNDNAGLIDENYGDVLNGDGTVTYNNEGGKVISSFGAITYNCGGTVEVVRSGPVNDGFVTIDNYYSGSLICQGSGLTIDIVNSYSDEDADYAYNQYHSVDITDTTGAEVAHVNFVADPLNTNVYTKTKDFDGEVEITGTITLKAKEGYKITDNGVMEGQACDNKLGYRLTKNNDGSYVVHISSLTGNVSLTPAELNLIIEEFSEGGGKKVIVETDDTVEVTDNKKSDVTAVAPVSAIFTAAQIQSMIESALADSFAKANGAAVTVIDLNLGNAPSLTADAVVALCSGSVAKRCHFTHNGQKFVLFVPVIDTTSIAYQQYLALLDAEPGKQAGPIRLSQILAPVGVTLSQE